MKQMINIRFMYDDFDMFTIRAKMFKDILIPCLEAQTNKDFIVTIMIDKFEDELREILQFPFFAVDEFYQLRDIAFDYDCQLMTAHDSDDWMSPDYVQTCMDLYKESEVETLLIHWDFDYVDYYTGEVLPYVKPPGHISGLYTICNKDKKYLPHMLGHTRMGSIADRIIEMPKGYVIYYQHDYNVLKLNKRGIRERQCLLKDINRNKKQ